MWRQLISLAMETAVKEMASEILAVYSALSRLALLLWLSAVMHFPIAVSRVHFAFTLRTVLQRGS